MSQGWREMRHTERGREGLGANCLKLRAGRDEINQCDPTLSFRSRSTLPMSTVVPVPTIASGEYGIHETESRDSAPYCGVCMNENHCSLICVQVKVMETFVGVNNNI